jgi:hypothetical protein
VRVLTAALLGAAFASISYAVALTLKSEEANTASGGVITQEA